MFGENILFSINFLDSAVQVFFFRYSTAVYPGSAAWPRMPRNTFSWSKGKLALEIKTTGSSEAYLPSQAASLIPYHLASVHSAINCVMSSKV